MVTQSMTSCHPEGRVFCEPKDLNLKLSKRKSLWRPGAIRNAKITAGKVAGKKSLRVLAFVGTAF
jgi:hypothetical protein